MHASLRHCQHKRFRVGGEHIRNSAQEKGGKRILSSVSCLHLTTANNSDERRNLKLRSMLLCAQYSASACVQNKNDILKICVLDIYLLSLQTSLFLCSDKLILQHFCSVVSCCCSIESYMHAFNPLIRYLHMYILFGERKREKIDI